MVILERVYTVDDVLRLEQQPMNPAEKYYLIDGELIPKMAPTELHGDAATRLLAYLFFHVDRRDLGRVLVECGYHPPGDRGTVLLPDVSFESKARTSATPLSTFVPNMPDLAVEVISPSQTLAQARRKARTYLRHGSALVWLLDPARKMAEIWRRDDDGGLQSEQISADGHLQGEDILPGFHLPLSDTFAV